jgi:hypothetical protein
VDRPLSPGEREILDHLLSADVPGADALRRQVDHTRVIGRCPCGCATIMLAVDRAASPTAAVSSRTPIDAMSLNNQYGLMLFVDDGYMSSVEIYGMAAAKPPAEFPPPSAFGPPY